jgi:hypothetical protein
MRGDIDKLPLSFSKKIIFLEALYIYLRFISSFKKCLVLVVGVFTDIYTYYLIIIGKSPYNQKYLIYKGYTKV